jgi:hypothetical protein
MSHCEMYQCKSSETLKRRGQSGSLVVGLLALLLINCGKQGDLAPDQVSGASSGVSSNVPFKSGGLARVPARTMSASSTGQEPALLPSELEPIPPYVLTLGRDHATLCWVTRDVCVGEVKLSGYADDAVYVEDRPASNYHRVKMTGLQAATT